MLRLGLEEHLRSGARASLELVPVGSGRVPIGSKVLVSE